MSDTGKINKDETRKDLCMLNHDLTQIDSDVKYGTVPPGDVDKLKEALVKADRHSGSGGFDGKVTTEEFERFFDRSGLSDQAYEYISRWFGGGSCPVDISSIANSSEIVGEKIIKGQELFKAKIDLSGMASKSIKELGINFTDAGSGNVRVNFDKGKYEAWFQRRNDRDIVLPNDIKNIEISSDGFGNFRIDFKYNDGVGRRDSIEFNPAR